MGGTSKRSFRINGLSSDLKKPAFTDIVHRLNNKMHSRYTKCSPRTSLAMHEDGKCSTVSCRSWYHKYCLMNEAQVCRDLTDDMDSPPLFEDSFSGLTVVYSPEDDDHSPLDAEIDICIVHGLNGNGIDTFERAIHDRKPPFAVHRRRTLDDMRMNSHREGSSVWKRNKPSKSPHCMWPRDLLHLESSFSRSRIMTFDYEASFRDNRDHGDLEQWSQELLASIDHAREGVPDRPIIFIGYSMGGILIRHAASDIWDRRGTMAYRNIQLRQCGFMFLGTPHHGTVPANVGRVMVVFLETLGFRTEMLDPMKHFSDHLPRHLRAWSEFSSDRNIGNRPVRCFAETRDSSVLGGLHHYMIVPHHTAYWMSARAVPIAGTDHHTICAYNNRHDKAYKQIVHGLEEIKEFLDRQSMVHEDRPFPRSGGLAGPPVPTSRSHGNVQDASMPSMQSVPPMASPQDERTPNSLQQPTPHRLLDLGTSNVAKVASTSATPILMSIQKIANSTSPHKEGPSTLVTDETFMHVNVVHQVLVMPTGYIGKVVWSQGNPGKAQDTPDQPTAPVRSKDQVIGSHPSEIGRDPESQQKEALDEQEQGVECDDSEHDPTQDEISASWYRKSVLSLDGGGVRGYITLLLLRKLMYEVDKLEHSCALPEDAERPWSARYLDKSSLGRSSSRSSGIPARITKPLSRFCCFSTHSAESSPKNQRIALQQAQEVYLPCHYFDYVFGSGTGGVTAIMLGRLRMSIHECIERYKTLTTHLFHIPQQPLVKNPVAWRSRRGRAVERRLREVAEYHTGHLHNVRDNRLLLKTAEDLCKTATTAFDIHRPGDPKLFRSYDNLHSKTSLYADQPHADTDLSVSDKKPSLRNGYPYLDSVCLSPGLADSCEIWQAAQATSASPSLFSPVKIGKSAYLDGGIALNNPSRESVNEVLSLHGQDHKSLNCLVSIGCGRPNRSFGSYHGGLKALTAKNALKAIAVDSISTHEGTRSITLALGVPYFRFDAPGDIWKLPHTRNGDRSGELYARLERDVDKYFQEDSEAEDQLKKCARVLIEQRKQRAQDSDRWRRFTHATFFRCPRCPHGKEEFTLRRQFEAHLDEKHTQWWKEKDSEKIRHEFINTCEKHPSIKGGPL